MFINMILHIFDYELTEKNFTKNSQMYIPSADRWLRITDLKNIENYHVLFNCKSSKSIIKIQM